MSDGKAINMPEALKWDAGRIWQLILNANSPWYGAGNARSDYPVEWPQANNVQYHVGGPVILELFDIRVVDYGPIAWSRENVVRTERESDVVATVRLQEGETDVRRIEHTFSKAKSLEESTLLGFETEAEAHLGSYESPAGASLKEKVTNEYASKFGTSTTETDTFSDTLTLTGPLHRRYTAYRDSVIAQRDISCRPILDHGIKIVSRFPDTRQWKQVIFKDRDEFLRFIRGEADDSIGVFEIGFEGGGPSERTAMAPFFRAHPQPGAAFDNTIPSLEWVGEYQTRIELGLDSEDI